MTYDVGVSLFFLPFPLSHSIHFLHSPLIYDVEFYRTMLPHRYHPLSNGSYRVTQFNRRVLEMIESVGVGVGVGIGGSGKERRTLIKLLIAASTIIILVFTIIILWTNYRECTILPSPNRVESSFASSSPPSVFDAERDIEDPLARDAYANLTHMILVTGHAVLAGLNLSDLYSPSSWILLPYQYGQVPTYMSHIRRGVELTRADPSALLVFTGGETRRLAGPRSEAQSYWMAAEHEGWFNTDTDAEGETAKKGSKRSNSPEDTPDPVSLRSTTEEYSRDSFENLLFSLCRFREVVGHYPSRVTVIGFEFKRKRFEELHRVAVRYPKNQFHYVGIDPPDASSESGDIASRQRHARLVEGERTNSYQPFTQDPYGCAHGGSLRLKKAKRNPFKRHHAYEHTCPELDGLLKWCGVNIFPNELPWNSPNSNEVFSFQSPRNDP